MCASAGGGRRFRTLPEGFGRFRCRARCRSQAQVPEVSVQLARCKLQAQVPEGSRRLGRVLGGYARFWKVPVQGHVQAANEGSGNFRCKRRFYRVPQGSGRFRCRQVAGAGSGKFQTFPEGSIGQVHQVSQGSFWTRFLEALVHSQVRPNRALSRFRGRSGRFLRS